MTFFIATIILGVAILSNQALLSTYGDEVARRSLEVVGNNVALRIESMDRVVRASAASGATVSSLVTDVPLPLQVAGRPYSIAIAPGSITLENDGSPSSRAWVPMNNSTPIASRNLSGSGGQIEIYYNASSGKLDFR